MQQRSKLFYWIAGPATSLVGVAVARLLGPRLPIPYQDIVFYIGTAIAITGIFIAALGAGSKPRDSNSR